MTINDFILTTLIGKGMPRETAGKVMKIIREDKSFDPLKTGEIKWESNTGTLSIELQKCILNKAVHLAFVWICNKEPQVYYRPLFERL